jgi:hypothetical protein
LAEPITVALRIQAEPPDIAAVRSAQPFDALDGGRLACAIRPEDAEDLAFLDAERDVVDRDVIAVSLVQVGDFGDRHASRFGHGAPRRIGYEAGSCCGVVDRSVHRSVDRGRRRTGRSG